MIAINYRITTCTEDLSDEKLPEDFQKSMRDLRYIAYTIIGPTLLISGILGNVLNLIVLARPFLNECTRTYLRALAIADINFLLFEIPLLIRLNGVEQKEFIFAFYHAHIELVLSTTFIAFNIYIVIFLTIDRYISVCFPEIFSTVHTKKKVTISLAVCFLIAIAVSWPLFLLKTVCRTNNCKKWSTDENIVITRTKYWHAYIILSEILIRIGPAIILATLNFLIIRKFKVITKKRQNTAYVPFQQYHYINSRAASATLNSSIKLRNKKCQEEKRLITLLQAVVVVFFITMIPSSCLSIIYSESQESNLNYQIFRALANVLEIMNSALNFCGYFLCSREFRRTFINIFIPCNKNNKNRKIEDVKIVSVQTILVQ